MHFNCNLSSTLAGREVKSLNEKALGASRLRPALPRLLSHGYGPLFVMDISPISGISHREEPWYSNPSSRGSIPSNLQQRLLL
jgi:hypothetical protein